jgi:hypothetical protein
MYGILRLDLLTYLSIYNIVPMECEYEGELYSEGEEFSCQHDCNTCNCKCAEGKVEVGICTRMTCSVDVPKRKSLLVIHS